MFGLTECKKRNTTCYDCDDESCNLAGEKMSDCPKYHCDNPNGIDDCDHCNFIDDYIEYMRKSYKRGVIKIIIAVDFDGVIVENRFPSIGRPHMGVINGLIERRKKGDKIILWTCRCGQQLADAVAFCRNMGLEFDAVNENLPMMIDKCGSDSRKVYADCYIDDRNKDAEWLLFRARTERMTPQLQEPAPRKTARIVRR